MHEKLRICMNRDAGAKLLKPKFLIDDQRKKLAEASKLVKP